MSMKLLGAHFDIHGGGLDLVFPHHENEVVQSESYTGQPFATYWLHNGLLTKDGRKISKSDPGTIVLMSDLLQAHAPDTLRALFLTSHYRRPIDYGPLPARRDRTWSSGLPASLRTVRAAHRRRASIQLAAPTRRGDSTRPRPRSSKRSPSIAAGSWTRWTTTSTPAAPSASCSRWSTP